MKQSGSSSHCTWSYSLCNTSRRMPLTTTISLLILISEISETRNAKKMDRPHCPPANPSWHTGAKWRQDVLEPKWRFSLCRACLPALPDLPTKSYRTCSLAAVGKWSWSILLQRQISLDLPSKYCRTCLPALPDLPTKSYRTCALAALGKWSWSILLRRQISPDLPSKSCPWARGPRIDQ